MCDRTRRWDQLLQECLKRQYDFFVSSMGSKSGEYTTSAKVAAVLDEILGPTERALPFKSATTSDLSISPKNYQYV